MFWKRKSNVEVAEPVKTLGLGWQRQGDNLVAYPNSREWEKYTVRQEMGGKYSVTLTGYRYNVSLGYHDTLEQAVAAANRDNRRRG